MALNDSGFKSKIISLLDTMIESEDYETAKAQYAEKLMQAIKEYIKSGTVSVNVTTTGNATNHTGSGTGKKK